MDGLDLIKRIFPEDTMDLLLGLAQVPKYVTYDQACQILDLMHSGKSHPENRACDYTLESAVGIVVNISDFFPPDGPSQYQLFYQLAAVYIASTLDRKG